MGKPKSNSGGRRVLPPVAARRFVELVRVSSAGQAARDTPEDQKTVLDEIRAERGGTLVERIEEPGVSGATDLELRLLVTRLRALAGQYDELRVVAMDRVARLSAFKAAPIMELLAATGAVIYDAKVGRELDPTTTQGSKELADLCAAAEIERESIAVRTIRGRKRKLLAGRHPQGAMPWGLGYQGPAPHRHVAGWLTREPASPMRAAGYCWDPVVIGHLSWAAARVVSGVPLRAITQDLLARGCVPPHGGNWINGSTLSKALRSDAYLGRWHGSVGGLEQMIEVPVALDLALVTDARAALQTRAKGGAAGGRTIFPLLGGRGEGRVTCGTCGGGMSPHSAHPKAGTRHLYYRCACCTKKRNVNHPMESVDQNVWATLDLAVCADGALVEEIAALASRPWVDDGVVAGMEAELKKRQARLTLFLRACDATDSPALLNELRDLGESVRVGESLLKAERAKVDAAKRAHQLAQADRDAMRDALGGIHREFADADFERRRKIVAALDVRVVLHKDGSALMETRLSSAALEFIQPRESFLVAPTAC